MAACAKAGIEQEQNKIKEENMTGSEQRAALQHKIAHKLIDIINKVNAEVTKNLNITVIQFNTLSH